MPVFNAARFVQEAARSILSGSFADLELLAINDGSTDESESILRKLHDRRVRIVNNSSNMGIIATLNRGLQMVRGEFVARMDADDVSLPGRLAQQLAFMEANPGVGISGTAYTSFGAGPDLTHRQPQNHDEIRAQLFAFNPMVHPTVIFRLKLLREHGLQYAPEAAYAEDLELWMRAAERFGLANIPMVALRHRRHPNQSTKLHVDEQISTVAKLRCRQLARLVPEATDREIALHLAVCDVGRSLDSAQFAAAKPWLERLEAANARRALYDATAFRSFLATRWLNAAHRCKQGGVQVWKTWRSSPLAKIRKGAGARLLFKIALRN